jgi:hypothetical protein
VGVKEWGKKDLMSTKEHTKFVPWVEMPPWETWFLTRRDQFQSWKSVLLPRADIYKSNFCVYRIMTLWYSDHSFLTILIPGTNIQVKMWCHKPIYP